MEFPSSALHLDKIPFDGRLLSPPIARLAGAAAHLPEAAEESVLPDA